MLPPYCASKLDSLVASSGRQSAEVAYIDVPRLSAWLVSKGYIEQSSHGSLLDFSLLQPVHINVNAICIGISTAV
jgi:hypothetical protein